MLQAVLGPKGGGQQRKERDVGADAVVPADKPQHNADEPAKAGDGRQQQRRHVQARQQPQPVARLRGGRAPGLPAAGMEQQRQQRQKAEYADDAQVAVAILVIHGAFVGGQQAEIALQPVGQLVPPVPVGREQQTADAQAVDIGPDGAAVDAVGQRAAHAGQHAQYHGEKVRDHPGDDLANGDKAGDAGGQPAVAQDQAQRRDAQEKAGEIRVVGRAVVGDAPGHGQRRPVALIAQKALAGAGEGGILGTPEAQQHRERHELDRRQHHVPGQALLHIGAQPERERKRKGQPAPHPRQAEHRVPGQRVGKRDGQHVQVEHDAGVLGKQPHESHKGVVDQIIVGFIRAGRLVERPAQRGRQVAVAALHLPHPVNAVAAVEHGYLPVQPPKLEKHILAHGDGGDHQHKHRALAQKVLSFVVGHKAPHSPRCMAAT